MASTVIIVTWDDMERANKALENLKSYQKNKMIDVDDAVVVVKDEEGKVTVKETEHLSTKRGAVFGGTAGLVVGLMLGGPVGGALLGAGAGILASKLDLGISNDQIEAVSESMDNASSAIFAEIKPGNKDLITSASRQSGGMLHELSITDVLEMDIEDTFSAATGSHQ